MVRGLETGVAVAALILLAACHRGAPSGQVVAKVDGTEITLQELNTELQTTTVPAGVNREAAQRALLQRVIERKLLDGLATKKGLDKSPDYLAQRRRLDEILLAQLYARQQLAAVQVPGPADISGFMTKNPGAFAARQQLILDQIRFQTPSNEASLKGIETTHTLDAVQAFLDARNIKYQRSSAGLDSATLPTALLAQINGLPAGEPFVIPTGGTLTVNVITARRPIETPQAQAQASAAAAWRQQKVQQLITDQLTQARNAAKIEYKAGFAPPVPPAAAPAKQGT